MLPQFTGRNASFFYNNRNVQQLFQFRIINNSSSEIASSSNIEPISSSETVSSSSANNASSNSESSSSSSEVPLDPNLLWADEFNGTTIPTPPIGVLKLATAAGATTNGNTTPTVQKTPTSKTEFCIFARSRKTSKQQATRRPA